MRSAGASTYANDTDSKVVHWVRQWVSPQQSPNVVSAPSEKRAQTPADAEKGTPASTPVSLSNLNFKVKQWIPDPDQEAHVAFKYGSTDDVIAFVTEVHAPPEVKNDNDLTASDIRGAVGGEAIPGMTTMDKQGDEEKPAEEKPAEPAAATAEEALNNTTIPEAKIEVDSSEMVVDAPEPTSDAAADAAADAAPAAVATEITTTTTTTTTDDAMDVDLPATEAVIETKEEVVVPEPDAEIAPAEATPASEPTISSEPAMSSEPAASEPAPVEALKSTVGATETTVTAVPTEAPAAVEPVVEAPIEPVPEVVPVVAEVAETVEPVKTEPAPAEPDTATDAAPVPETAAPAVAAESTTESADVEMKDA